MENVKSIFKFSGIRKSFQVALYLFLVSAATSTVVEVILYLTASEPLPIDRVATNEFLNSWWNILLYPFIASFEEVIFVLPVVLLFMIHKDIKNQILSQIAFLLFLTVLFWSSYQFMIGHAYQGNMMYGKMFYVAASSYFMSRYGLYTSMLAHFFIDFFLLLISKILVTIIA